MPEQTSYTGEPVVLEPLINSGVPGNNSYGDNNQVVESMLGDAQALDDPIEPAVDDATQSPAADPISIDDTIDPNRLTSTDPLQPPTDIGDTLDTPNEVTGQPALVETRLDGLLSRNSDYMKRAEARANQYSNSRGLLNSSMAVDAAYGAAIDAALPIASQDAAEISKTNFEAYSADLQAQLISIQSSYNIQQNLDSVNGAIYQQLTSEIGLILANTDDPGEANARIEALLQSAGAELEFSNGTTLAMDAPVTAPVDPSVPRNINGGREGPRGNGNGGGSNIGDFDGGGPYGGTTNPVADAGDDYGGG